MQGMAQNVIANLDPYFTDKIPKRKVPTMAPRLTEPATHDKSDSDNGPVRSGVCSDMRVDNAGESHPIKTPYETIIKLAELKTDHLALVSFGIDGK